MGFHFDASGSMRPVSPVGAIQVHAPTSSMLWDPPTSPDTAVLGVLEAAMTAGYSGRPVTATDARRVVTMPPSPSRSPLSPPALVLSPCRSVRPQTPAMGLSPPSEFERPASSLGMRPIQSPLSPVGNFLLSPDTFARS